MKRSNCKYCDKPLSDHKKRYNAKYCGERCRKDDSYEYNPDKRTTSTTNRGASAELLVCADLLKMGYYCYRSVSPHAPFDLLAYGRGDVKRIEVKSGNKSKVTGNIAYTNPRNDEYDILAIVATNTGEVIYEPEIDEYGWH